MKALNKLVELAKKATPGKWWIDSHGHSMVAFSGEAGDVEIVFATDNDMGPLVRHGDTGNLSHWRNDNDATFIAAANPDTILAIAESFRELEKEAQKNLEGAFAWQNRAEAAEAKLAQREKLDEEAMHCATILEFIGNFESDDIDGDLVDLRFEIDGEDTGCDVSITEYALRSAKAIRAIISGASVLRPAPAADLAARERDENPSFLLLPGESEYDRLERMYEWMKSKRVASSGLTELVPDEIPGSFVYQGAKGAFDAGKSAGWNACRDEILKNIEERESEKA